MKKTIGFMVLLATVCSVASAEVITFQNNVGLYDGGVDSGIRQEQIYRNYGASPSNGTGWETQEMITFYRFDDMFGNESYQLPYGATITSATLRLFCEGMDYPTESRTQTAYAVTLPLDFGNKVNSTASEGEICWYFRACDVEDWGTGSHAGPVAGVDYTTTDAASTTFGFSGTGAVDWDVTAMVQKWYAGTLDNNGIVLRQTGSTDWLRVTYTMEEGGGNAPALVITYEVPEPTTMMLLLAGSGVALLRRRKA